ncbi:DUF3566 domain-containing protein [Bifidobacterium amazonense]|uniref:DUF3566 domain-containing protein n=1 Tax=Bifidobacterium amazonense TaxID=2809027 RepID=A0ABS9VY44_9BIFI|nr:DUF3566 domain-containing protein [Bifidobacterium amazonense]MCH9276836.1 DUF3566 domain-containing protein [Bifidobacterium amazonense]
MSDNVEESNEDGMIQPVSFAPEHAGDEPGEVGHRGGHGHAGRVARSAVGEAGIADSAASAGTSGVSGSSEPLSAAPASVPPASKPARRGTPRARRMNLSVTHISAWSMAKVSFLLSIAGAIIQIVAVMGCYFLLDFIGVFKKITAIVSSTGLDAGSFDLTSIFNWSTVLSAVTIFGIVQVVVFTILATILTLLYNVVTALVGGVHVTLGDD